MADIIIVTCQKGGVGKTTTTINVAACLAAKGKKVLVVVADPQDDLTEKYLDGVIDPTGFSSLSDVIEGKCTIADAVYATREHPIYEVVQGLFGGRRKAVGKYTMDILPAGWGLNFLTMEDPELFSKALDKEKDRYDYILIDSPPAYAPPTLLAMNAADFVIVPVEPDRSSFGGYALVLQVIQELKAEGKKAPKILGVVMNTYTGFSLDQALLDELKDAVGDDLFETSIRRSQKIGEAAFFGTPVISYNKNPVAEDYEALTNEVVARIAKSRGEVYGE